MPTLNDMYYRLLHGKHLWGNPPTCQSFEEFIQGLDASIADASLYALNQVSTFDPLARKHLEEYIAWRAEVQPHHIEQNRPANMTRSGQTSYTSELLKYGGAVYQDFVGDEWKNELRAWEQNRSDIRFQGRYAHRRVASAFMVLGLSLLPILSFVDFAYIWLSRGTSRLFHPHLFEGNAFAWNGWFWKDNSVRDFLDFAMSCITFSKRGWDNWHDNIVGIAVFFCLSAGTVAWAAVNTLWNGYLVHSGGNDNEDISKPLSKVLWYGIGGTFLWWVPAVLAGGAISYFLYAVLGVILVLGYSVKKGVSRS